MLLLVISWGSYAKDSILRRLRRVYSEDQSVEKHLRQSASGTLRRLLYHLWNMKKAATTMNANPTA
jgi:hypothetical protein